MTLRMTSAILSIALYQLAASVYCVTFDINMELILNQIIRIGCRFYVRLYE